MAFKSPQNFRASPVQITGEAIVVSGGVALLAEAPADPNSFATTITIAGAPRTLVTGTPQAGQYSILTQTVIGADQQPHLEYLPVLQFNGSDEGLAGLATYFGTGTILSAQFFAMLLAFLTPLTGMVNVSLLPTPTLDTTQRGRPGDVAFLLDGSAYFSDGGTWQPFASGVPPSTSMSVAATMAQALDAGYVGPSFADGVALGAVTIGAALDAVWLPQSAPAGQITVAYALGLLVDAVQAEAASMTATQTLGLAVNAVQADVGALTVSETLAMSVDALLGLIADDSFSVTLPLTMDASYSGGSVAVSDDFNRADSTGLGANWTAITGRTSLNVLSNEAQNNGGAHSGNRWSANTFNANHYSEAQVSPYDLGVSVAISGSPADLLGVWPVVRVQSGANSFYALIWYAFNDGADPVSAFVAIVKIAGGVFTLLANVDATAGGFDGNTVYRLEVSGTTLTGYTGDVHGSLTSRITATDAALSGGSPGIAGDSVTVGPEWIDNWYGGDL